MGSKKTLIEVIKNQDVFSHWARFVFVFAFLFFLSACYSTPPQIARDENASPPAESGFSVAPPNINLAKPLEVSKRAEDVALCQKINQTIDESEFANARWGVIAISLKDVRVACARDAQKLFNPASLQKILTSLVALDTLGAEFRWKTSLYSAKQIEPDGTLNGDLILYGQGAPDFDTQALENLVNQLQAKGLKRVKGNLVGDESFFKGENIGDGWVWNELQWYYGAEASALTFNENQAFINVENGVARSSTDYLQVSLGTTAPPKKGEPESSGIARGLADNNFHVWGSAKNWGTRVAVHNPKLWAARSLKEALEKRGIAVEGETKSVDWKAENKSDAVNLVELAALESQTLGEIVQKMNKRSINLYAELILRTIGKRFGESAPDDNAKLQEVRGDDSAGAAVIKKWLHERHVATEEIEIHDGSGLSRLDFVTPEAFGRALIYAAQSPFAEIFKNSLPVAATDGTLGGRLAKAKGKILAKTGSVTFVNSLAGYVQNSTDEIFAFAIICNNETRKADSTKTIDEVALIFAGDGEEEAEKGTNKNKQFKETNKSPFSP